MGSNSEAVAVHVFLRIRFSTGRSIIYKTNLSRSHLLYLLNFRKSSWINYSSLDHSFLMIRISSTTFLHDLVQHILPMTRVPVSVEVWNYTFESFPPPIIHISIRKRVTPTNLSGDFFRSINDLPSKTIPGTRPERMGRL